MHPLHALQGTTCRKRFPNSNHSGPYRTRLGSTFRMKKGTAAATPSAPKMARTAMLCRVLPLHCASRNCSSSGSGNEKTGCAEAGLRGATAARFRKGCGSPSRGGLASSMRVVVQTGTQQRGPEMAPEQLMQGTSAICRSDNKIGLIPALLSTTSSVYTAKRHLLESRVASSNRQAQPSPDALPTCSLYFAIKTLGPQRAQHAEKHHSCSMPVLGTCCNACSPGATCK